MYLFVLFKLAYISKTKTQLHVLTVFHVTLLVAGSIQYLELPLHCCMRSSLQTVSSFTENCKQVAFAVQSDFTSFDQLRCWSKTKSRLDFSHRVSIYYLHSCFYFPSCARKHTELWPQDTGMYLQTQ